MSNCIQVNNDYCPFRWEGKTLLAFVGERWVEVERTKEKNHRGEWVFRVKAN